MSMFSQILTHSGAIPGFSTRVAFLPDDGLGIVVLANADEKAAANEAILYRIVEDVLGLKRVDRTVTVDATWAFLSQIAPGAR